ncbi:unnamed protein product [Cylindrotheca closterium]|uniref:Uncharacterized protein n=1 Tax=Cylindrotheca closterium TaxID=2856 RepID=A0AAD2FFJ0_9STRA|nr:unnamed protein product [Cylindrotheca closterium]
MPYATVEETVTQTRRVRICARCHRQIGSNADLKNLSRAGSLIGSLGTSYGASVMAGAVLGPVGMIGGAIAGSFAGAHAGAKVGTKASEMAEDNKSQPYCPECQAIITKEEQARGVGRTTGESGGENNAMEFLKRVSGSIRDTVEQQKQRFQGNEKNQKNEYNDKW